MDKIQIGRLVTLAVVEIDGVLQRQDRLMLFGPDNGLFDVRRQHGAFVDPGVGEEAVGGLDVGPGLEAARQSLAAMPAQM